MAAQAGSDPPGVGRIYWRSAVPGGQQGCPVGASLPGVNGLWPLAKGKKQPVAIGQVDENNPWAVRRWLEPLVKRLGVSVMVSADLASFHNVAEKLGLEHQVCQFHVRRWVRRTLSELRETIPEAWL